MKRFQTKRLAFYLLLLTGFACIITSCKDDDGPAVFDRPNITLTTSNPTVQVGQAIDIMADVEAPGTIASVTATATAGTATISNASALNGQTSGDVTINFTAPATAGTATITLTVTDTQNPARSENEIITVNVTEEPAKPVKDIFAAAGGTGTITLDSDTTYVLRGFVFVNSGQTLTIEPGTVIKGQPGQSTGASALIVARGARIIANGTPEAPIIMTALADDETRPDDIDRTQRGLWGGLIILGDAPINTAAAAPTPNNPELAAGQAFIEGIPSTEPRGIYGGSTPADNSGELSYISIRHAGTLIGAGNEINGLTLGGVGSGTKISYIEVWGNDDDGIEWFGGTVNTDHLAALYCQDDAFDWDYGFTSQNQFWAAVQTPGFTGSDRGMELDGVAGNNRPTATFFSNPTIYNMTLIGQGATGNTAAAIFLEEGTGGKFINSIIMQFNRGIQLGTNAGAGAFSIDRLGTDLLFQNIIWFNVADGTVAGIAGGNATLVNYLNNAANANVIGDPGIPASDASGFNVVPAAGSLAFTHPKAPIPAAANGFTYTQTDYVGAFGTTNWLEGWTAADAYGFLK